MSSSEVKLIAVWTSKTPPPAELKLSDYRLPLAGDLPEGYFSALYGNRVAYSALADVLTDAQNRGLYFSTAVVTVALKKERKPGVVHLSEIGSGAGGMVNLTRVSKEVVSRIAEVYKRGLVHSNDAHDGQATLELPADAADMDWRKPHRFMPDQPDCIPEVFDLLQCEVLVHPVRMNIQQNNTVHFVATMRLDEVEIVSAEPNRFEVGPHPDRILF